jgi:hypothetical protein
MSNSIKIDFFDINGEYNEDVEVDIANNFLLIDSPMRILEKFINENFLQDLKKDCEDKYITKYSFSYNIPKNEKININCNIINNFSISHSEVLESNGYCIFCNLENKKTLDLLDKLIDYIIEYCGYKIKTYIIGVYKEKIDESMDYTKMNNLLKSLDFEYNYYEMYIGDKDKFEMIKATHNNSETMENVFKSIFYNICGEEIAPPKIKKGIIKDKDSGSHGSKCKIF